MSNELVKIEFYGGEIEAVKIGDDIWISLRRACEHIGVDVDGQRVKLKDQPWACTGVISVQVGNQKRDMFMINAASLPAWVFSISASKIKEENREILIAYQKEAANVLRDYFYGNNMWHIPEMSSEALSLLLSQVQRAEKAEKENKLLAPYAEAGKALRGKRGDCLIRVFCKMIRIDGRVIGEKKMFEVLRMMGILMKNNEPYQEQIDAGRFRLQEGQHPDGKGGMKQHWTPKITPKGQGYVINRLKNDELFIGRSIVVDDNPEDDPPTMF